MPTLEIINWVDQVEPAPCIDGTPVDPDCIEFADSALIAVARIVFPGQDVTPTVEAGLLLGLL